MPHSTSWCSLVAVLASSLLVGCGSDLPVQQPGYEEIEGEGEEDRNDVDDGDEDDGHPTSGTTSGSSSGSGDPPTSSGAGGDDTGSTGAGGDDTGSSTSSSSGAGGGSSSSGGGCDFDAPNACNTADELDAIAGDQDQDVRTLAGTGSMWIKVYVEEANSSISLQDLRYTVALQSPAGMDYDVAVHAGDGSEPGCMSAPEIASGTPEMVSLAKGDVPISNQGHWIGIFVEHVSGGSCDPGSEWTLKVVGNYAPVCQTDGQCTLDDDCVCGDCGQDAYCSDTANCSDDGTCDSYNEGCGCGDCAGLPPCG